MLRRAGTTHRIRHGAAIAALLLCLFVCCAGCRAATALTAGWRLARAGDTPQKVLDDWRSGHLRAFDPAQLQRFRCGEQGCWIVLAPQPPWLTRSRVIAAIPPDEGKMTLYDSDGTPRAQSLDDTLTSFHGNGLLAWRIPAEVPAATPILIHFAPAMATSTPVSFQLLDWQEYRQLDSGWVAFASACFAVMLTLGLMAAFFAMMMHEGTFGWYAGFILCYALTQGFWTGYLYHPLHLDWLAGLAHSCGTVSFACTVSLATVFMIRFCELERYARRLRLPLYVLAAGIVLALASRDCGWPPLAQAGQWLLNPLVVIGAMLMLLSAAMVAARGGRYAIFFLLSWTPLLVLAALTGAQDDGALPHWIWLNDGCLGAGAFGALVLSLAMADRALTVRRDRDIVRVLADKDALTDVLNRRAWNAAVRDLLTKQESMPTLPGLAVLFMDLDHFKLLNDCQGHSAGDRALVQVAEALRQELRPGDLLGRYGGEEFVAMLNHISAEQAMHVATRLCRRIHRMEIPVDGKATRLSISIGVAMRRAGDSVESVIERADKAMYEAKLEGRNRVRLYETGRPSMLSAVRQTSDSIGHRH